MNKPEIRRSIRAIKNSYSSAQLDQMSVEACSRLESNPVYDSASVVLLYESLPDEVNTSSLIQRAVADGKTVLLPVVVGDDLELRAYTDEQSLTIGAFNISEPEGEPYNGDVDVAVIPGMAFSQDGIRLGRGKGFYDRLLSTLPCYKIGLCFSFQIMDLSAVAEEHDVLMDEVVSD